MRCCVVMPVGPGHELLALDAIDSVTSAASRPGGFNDIRVVRIDDTHGQLGRSAARNEGVRQAQASGADWIFFLDADDVMHPDSFETARPFLHEYDGVWGAIYELAEDEESGIVRPNQLRTMSTLAELLCNDPCLTLQMGHFVKTRVAVENPFDVALDAGEDVDYYLRVWSQHKCIKISAPLFFNRRGMHSCGPRAATGIQWFKTAQELIVRKCVGSGLHHEFTYGGQHFRFHITNPFDLIQRCHLKGRFFEAAELDYVRTWVPRDARIVEVGAYLGNHAVYYSRFLQPRSIVVIEPNQAIIDLLRKNLAANGVTRADLSLLGIAAGDQKSVYRIVSDKADNLGASRLEPAPDGSVESGSLDSLIAGPVDFMKIDVEGMELAVLRGASDIVARSRPKIMIEVMMGNVEAFSKWVKKTSYRVAREFRYVNAINFMVEPIK